MCKTCHIFGVDLVKLDSGEEAKKKETEFGVSVWSCKACRMKHGQESLRQEALTPYTTPMISPTISLKSSDSFVSSCSELLVDEQLQGSREDENEGAADTSQEHANSSFHNPAKRIDGSGSLNVEIFDDNNNGLDARCVDNNTLKDESNTKVGTTTSPEGSGDHIEYHSQFCSSSKKGAELSYSFNVDTDPSIWLPPEPVDLEDDVEGSVANYDDDEEFSDGTNWGEPSFLGRFSGKRLGSFRFQEDCQKALTEVMRGEFKNLVSRLLTSVGISLSGEAGENWVDIVTSLAWKAALLVKPDDIQGKAMDPEGYVKVKCIATGRRCDSQLIKGLVFKKNAALKHMPTKYKNPRLMLFQGTLGQSSSGLLSLNSMGQEKDNAKSLGETIGMFHPNVVLVEKTVSRDVQEALLGKGITLVFDMKLHRLERIARCTGAQVISSADNLMSQKLKQCEFFHIDKFVEEHNSSKEGGKRMIKTLMFLEGCPRPLDCTVLLKGAHSDELKKVKRVISCAVVMAYRLILDTSFLVGQRTIFSTTHSGLGDEKLSSTPCLEESLAGNASSLSMDIPIADDEFQEISTYERTSQNGLKNKMVLSASSPDIHFYNNGERPCIPHNLPENGNDHQLETYRGPTLPTILHEQLLSSISTSLKKEREANDEVHEPELHSSQEAESLSALCEVPLELSKFDVDDECHLLVTDDISTLLDAQSILFLMSSQSVLRGAVCEQSHICRIKYYRNFDVTLGWYLCNSLLNQTHQCSICGDTPAAHAYNYVHQSGKLTVRVKQLSEETRLPGEEEGKIWMWARCSKCLPMSSKQRDTRRVVMSTAARSLSFGKFLELSFSIYSTSDMSSSCGHSMHKDYLLFYGLGPRVAMFQYSPVNVYTACMPSPVLEFNNQFGQEFIKKEAENVLKKGVLLFTEVKNTLQKMGSGVFGSSSKPYFNQTGLLKEFTKLEEMLKQEKSDFEAHIHYIIHWHEPREQDVYKLLNLNRLIQDLVLQSYVWDRRLHLLLSCDFRIVNAGLTNGVCEEPAQLKLQKDGVSGRTEGREDTLHDGDESSDRIATTVIGPINNDESPSSCGFSNDVIHRSNLDEELEIRLDETSAIEEENSSKEFHVSELQHGDSVLGSASPDDALNSTIEAEANGRLTMESSSIDESSLYEGAASTACRFDKDSVTGELSSNVLSRVSTKLPLHDENFQERCLPIYEPLQAERELLGDSNSVANSGITGSTLGEISSKSWLQGLESSMHISGTSLLSALADSEGWIWAPFPEISKAHRKDFLTGCPHKFDSIDGYNPKILSTAIHLATEEGYELHVPLGHENNVVSSYEGEPTSIIACALALFHCRHSSAKDLVGEEVRKEKVEDNKVFGIAESVVSDGHVTSPYWSSNDSLDSDWINSRESFSTEESYTSSFHGLNLVDSLLSSKDLHPEIHLGTGKITGKAKYSVVCVYAKLFDALRRRCCSELDYIASLSRCKNWDAKGGKSGSFFVKTLDDRFIVKQIKKTEFESFIKFAPDYFKYVNESISSGNQTCLAKILGIYQVTIRQSRSGKDLKYDLMVMENLLFGRNIARLYDLKGAQYARYTSNADGVGKVLLDQNFVEDMNTSPFYVSGRAKHLLQRGVWNDTSFLTSINVMDYSLLVGLDLHRRELVCGIIDYLRQYTWDKHLETWVKASLVVPKNVSPTVVSPKEYKKRFRKFMSMYFMSIPDHWCQERSSGRCKFCGARCGDPSPLRKVEEGET